MNISYLITCSTETDTLDKLLRRLRESIDLDDDIVILQDSDTINESSLTYAIVDKYLREGATKPNISAFSHSLNKNYSEHKNYGMSKCYFDYIFQIDGDECPTEQLLYNIKDIIILNPDIEAFWIPRINDFKGVTSEHALKWGWRLSPSTSITHEKIIDTNSEEYIFLKKNGYILEEITV